jgi:hypothetical protein
LLGRLWHGLHAKRNFPVTRAIWKGKPTDKHFVGRLGDLMTNHNSISGSIDGE